MSMDIPDSLLAVCGICSAISLTGSDFPAVLQATQLHGVRSSQGHFICHIAIWLDVLPSLPQLVDHVVCMDRIRSDSVSLRAPSMQFCLTIFVTEQPRTNGFPSPAPGLHPG